MVSPEARAVHFVELAIRAQEGPLVVDGVPFRSAIQTELARHCLAERAVAEASLLFRFLSLNPACAWCDAPIRQTQDAREVEGRLYHDEAGLPCARDFEDECADYAADRAAAP